jgi:membrane-bound lytic murein transglycosylase D
MPQAPPPAPAPAPARAPVAVPPAADSTPPVTPLVVPRADSLALAKQARDSALDAAMLDRLATARPPDSSETTTPNTDAELRSLFDIDVANWADHNRVKFYLNFFTGLARERMSIWLGRMPQYEPIIRGQLIAHGLPGDLAYLPLIESGYSATAVSRARAVGMWQFMRGTARLYGLKVDNWVDERRDVVKATDAAIRYLADLTARFGSPYLAAAAYNGGPGRIERGLARIDVDDEPDSTAVDQTAPQAGDAAFFQLADTRYLKRETKDYVPKLIAAALIAKQPARYGFPAAAPAATLMSDSVVVGDATGLDVIARLAGTSLADLWGANPSFVRAVTPPNRPAVVRVPSGSGSSTQTALNALPASERLTSFAHHTRSGETLARIAKRYGLSLAEVKSFNPEFRTRSPHAGDIVRIPGQARLSGWVSEDRRVESSAAGGTHRVRAGETLGSIAKHYHVSVTQLRIWNDLGPKAALKVGQTIRLAPSGSKPSLRKPASRATHSAQSVPAPRVHVVKAGETLTSLARRYKVTVQALRTANSLPAGKRVQAGQRLTIPS